MHAWNRASTALNRPCSKASPTTVDLLMTVSPWHTAIASFSRLLHLTAFCWSGSNTPCVTGSMPRKAACISTACHLGWVAPKGRGQWREAAILLQNNIAAKRLSKVWRDERICSYSGSSLSLHLFKKLSGPVKETRRYQYSTPVHPHPTILPNLVVPKRKAQKYGKLTLFQRGT